MTLLKTIVVTLSLSLLSVLFAVAVLSADLSTFTVQDPFECITPEERKALAEEQGFVLVEEMPDVNIKIWQHPSGLVLLDGMLEKKSCIIGWKQVEMESV